MRCVCVCEVPELFGPVRTVAEGRGESLLIGTTKNFVLQGSLDGEFSPITQVGTEHPLGLLTLTGLEHSNKYMKVCGATVSKFSSLPGSYR